MLHLGCGCDRKGATFIVVPSMVEPVLRLSECYDGSNTLADDMLGFLFAVIYLVCFGTNLFRACVHSVCIAFVKSKVGEIVRSKQLNKM